jgi:hypothetical protein
MKRGICEYNRITSERNDLIHKLVWNSDESIKKCMKKKFVMIENRRFFNKKILKMSSSIDDNVMEMKGVDNWKKSLNGCYNEKIKTP